MLPAALLFDYFQHIGHGARIRRSRTVPKGARVRRVTSGGTST